MRGKQLAVLAVIALMLVPTTAVASVSGSPELAASAASTTFVPGEDATLSITLANEGDLSDGSLTNPSLNAQVTTARGVQATLDAGTAPIEIETGTQTLGSLPEGQHVALPYELSVASDAQPGTYTVELTVEYSYTATISEVTGAANQATGERHFDITIEIDDRARFEIVDTESDVRVGAAGTVAVTMANVGSEAANATTVSLTSQNTDITFGGSASASRFVGAWAPGERRTIQYQVRAARTAEQQQYSFTARATFEDSDGVTRQSEQLSLGVTPGAEQQFSVLATTSTVAVGDTGTVTVRLRNEGPIAVNDATVALESQSGDLVFGESAAARRFVGDWAPGEVRTVAYDVTATGGADTRSYVLQATVSYDDREDESATSAPLSVSVTPAPEQGFALSNVSSTLRAGEEGTIRGTITNTGRTVARDVVVQFRTENRHINPAETEYSVGTLQPGASATFTFTVEVSAGATAGPRQLSFVAAYRTSEGASRTSDALLTRQMIGAQTNAFGVEVVDGRLATGGSTQLTVRVTNRANETLSSISAKLFADDPISASDDEAFIQRLAPGESTTITFSIAASGAMPKTYPVSVDFQYDDADGDTLVSDTYRVPIQVRERQRDGGGGLPFTVVGVGLVAVVGIAAVLRYR